MLVDFIFFLKYFYSIFYWFLMILRGSIFRAFPAGFKVVKKLISKVITGTRMKSIVLISTGTVCKGKPATGIVINSQVFCASSKIIARQVPVIIPVNPITVPVIINMLTICWSLAPRAFKIPISVFFS